jgi:thymidylate kinase
MKLINTFLEKLGSTGVNYVHWKSNTNIKQALSGVDDLDILVDPTDEDKIQSIFNELKFVRAFSDKDSWQEGITHYLGLDILKGELVHVHLHFMLSLGYDYDKCFKLPIVKEYLNNKTLYDNTVFLPSYENEYCILVIRLILKNALTPFLLKLPNEQLSILKNVKKNGVVNGSGYKEFLDLKSKTTTKELEECLKNNFPFLSAGTFRFLENVLIENNKIKLFFKAGRKLKKEIKNYRDYGELTSFIKAFMRLNSIRSQSLLRKLKISKKVNGKLAENGGRIIAFIGGDGAGKSTTISNLYKLFKGQLAIKTIHIGRPPNGVKGMILNLSKKIVGFLGFKDFSLALNYLRVAYGRRRAFYKACKLRDKGVIVLLDRMPINGITAMDCPRISTIKKNKYKKLAKIEKKQYDFINGVDQIFLLKLNPLIAIKRRPEDNKEELLIRSGQVWNKDWKNAFTDEINTEITSVKKVIEITSQRIWSSICKPYTRVEVVGLNGTGKSTLFSEIEKEIPNVHKCIDINDYKLLSLYVYCKQFIPSFRVLFITKKIKYVKIYFKFFITLEIIKKWNKYNLYKCKNLILDQGPIFQLSFLHKEKCISERNVERYLIEIEKAIPNIFYLKAPKKILFSRVKNRKGTITRGQFMTFEDFMVFCKSYNKSYKIIKRNYSSYYKISTKKNNVSQVFKKFKKEVYDK